MRHRSKPNQVCNLSYLWMNSHIPSSVELRGFGKCYLIKETPFPVPVKAVAFLVNTLYLHQTLHYKALSFGQSI